MHNFETVFINHFFFSGLNSKLILGKQRSFYSNESILIKFLKQERNDAKKGHLMDSVGIFPKKLAF